MISIIVEDIEAAEKINHLLHNYRQYIIGRMGLPYRPKKISIISIAIYGPLQYEFGDSEKFFKFIYFPSSYIMKPELKQGG